MTPRTTNSGTTSSSGSSGLLERNVTVIRDSSLHIPELYLEVYVVGDEGEQRAFAEMFVKAKCRKAFSVDTADLVVFTGGEDVDPIYYNESRHSTTYSSLKRDKHDIDVYKECLEKGIPMFGVCRGAQFLAVMNGCKLFQHVDNHTGDHSMWDVQAGQLIDNVSSVHHQMVRIPEDNPDFKLLGTSKESRIRWKNKTDKQEGNNTDVEAFFFTDVCAFGVQGHPEYKGYFKFQQWCFQQMKDLIVQNPDIAIEKGHYRIKPEVLYQRQAEQLKAKELN